MQERQFRSIDAETAISFLWLVMALPWESHSREIRSKNKPADENIVQLHSPTHRLLLWINLSCLCRLVLIVNPWTKTQYVAWKTYRAVDFIFFSHWPRGNISCSKKSLFIGQNKICVEAHTVVSSLSVCVSYFHNHVEIRQYMPQKTSTLLSA